MNLFNRTPAAEQFTVATTESAGNADLDASSATEMSLTRAGAAWVDISAATVVAILVIIFLVQTPSGPGELPWEVDQPSLALMLLLAAVSGNLHHGCARNRLA